jgi:O-antigen/teichoic acid export membrane protein
VAWWVIARPPLALRRDRIWSDWRHNWSFGRWALVGFLLGSSGAQIIPWLLASLSESGAAATGLLAANVSLIGLTNIFSLGMSNLLSPRAARTYATHGPAALRRLLLRFATAYLCVLGCFCLLVAVSGDALVVLVYGDKFAGAGSILFLLALNALVNSLGVTAGNGLWAIEKPQANFAADACVMASSLIAALALIPAFGVAGAAAAMLIGTSVGTVVRIATLQRAMT